jgi:hypothetical protein
MALRSPMFGWRSCPRTHFTCMPRQSGSCQRRTTQEPLR